MEVIEDRNGSSSTLVSSQLPAENWHERIGNPTIADALLYSALLGKNWQQLLSLSKKV